MVIIVSKFRLIPRNKSDVLIFNTESIFVKSIPKVLFRVKLQNILNFSNVYMTTSNFLFQTLYHQMKKSHIYSKSASHINPISHLSIPKHISYRNDVMSIFCLEYILDQDQLVVAEKDGQAFQYDLSDGKSHCKLIKDYGNLSIGKVLSSASNGSLVVFGGSESTIILIDSKRREVNRKFIETAVGLIYGMSFCFVGEKSVYLAVCGVYTDYDCDDQDTDVLDFSEIVKSVKGREIRKVEKRYINKKAGVID